MVEFDRTINQSEANSYYLNLSDDCGHHFGKDFVLPHLSKIAVVDGEGRVTYTQKHHKTQLWGTLKKWYIDNHADVGSHIHLRFDPKERRVGLPVLHLLVVMH
jgi:hypothetical protein